MKRYPVFFLFVLLLAWIMIACGNHNKNTEVTVASTETLYMPTETQPTEVTVSTQPVVLSEFDDYVFTHTDQRDLDWEEDIVNFAKMYLGEGPVKGHPKLANKWFTVCDRNNHIATRYFFDATLRGVFIEEIYKLINRITGLTDLQINYEMQRIVALLEDAHSNVNTPQGLTFPFEVQQLDSDGALGLYVTGVIPQYTELLYAQLLAINDYSIEEVRSMLAQYISAENIYHIDKVIFHDQMILDCSALWAVGIVDTEQDTAVFQFRTVKDETVEISLQAVFDIDYGEHTQRSLSMSQYGQCNYFGTPLNDDTAYYIRLYFMHSDSEYRLQQFLWDCDKEIKSMDSVDRLVIDIRMNPGGYQGFAFELLDYLKESDFDQICILTDGGTSSAAVWFSSFVRAKVEKAILVGTPTSQPPNFFAGSSNVYELKNHDIYFTISASYFEIEKDFDGSAVMPDILVYQNLQDYMQGIDTQLEAALEMEKVA